MAGLALTLVVLLTGTPATSTPPMEVAAGCGPYRILLRDLDGHRGDDAVRACRGPYGGEAPGHCRTARIPRVLPVRGRHPRRDAADRHLAHQRRGAPAPVPVPGPRGAVLPGGGRGAEGPGRGVGSRGGVRKRDGQLGRFGAAGLVAGASLGFTATLGFALYGNELVPETARLAAMNLLLHNIGAPDRIPLIKQEDALKREPQDLATLVLANPPVGTKSSQMISNKDEIGNGKVRQNSNGHTYSRRDFWTKTPNKQLNFLQHIGNSTVAYDRQGAQLPPEVEFDEHRDLSSCWSESQRASVAVSPDVSP